MATIQWDETTPADGDSLGQGDDQIRSLKTAIREGLATEHVWSSSGGASTGVHKVGSGRAYVNIQSAVSAAGATAALADGRLMVTSDTTRLFTVPSQGTLLVGAGPGSLSLASFPGGALPQRHYWVEEVGADGCVNTANITFPNSGFSGLPYVFVSAWSDAAGTVPPTIVGLTAIDFTVQSSRCTILWRSLGTRVL